MSLLDRQQDYSFNRYFDMGIEASDLATELGYTLTRKNPQLPQFPGELDRLVELHDRLKAICSRWALPTASSMPIMLIRTVSWRSSQGSDRESAHASDPVKR
jgi:hypothetical protein